MILDIIYVDRKVNRLADRLDFINTIIYICKDDIKRFIRTFAYLIGDCPVPVIETLTSSETISTAHQFGMCQIIVENDS